MIEVDLKEFGERIKDLRMDLGLSQGELADKIGAARNTVSQYESGKSRTSIDVLANLAVALDTTTDYLLGLEH